MTLLWHLPSSVSWQKIFQTGSLPVIIIIIITKGIYIAQVRKGLLYVLLFLHTTYRKYHIAYLLMPFPMTLEVIRLMQDLSNAIRWTFVRHLARF